MALARWSVPLAPCSLAISATSATALGVDGIQRLPLMAQLSLLLAIVAGLSVLIFTAEYLGRLAYGFFQHHRACRIKAVLVTKEDHFDGFLTVIGLDGCRFHPADKAVERHLLSAMASPVFCDFDIRIGRTAYPVFLDGFHGYFAALYFFEPIERVDLHKALELSTIPPVLVASVGHPTTRRKWIEDITLRRKKIAAMRLQHRHLHR